MTSVFTVKSHIFEGPLPLLLSLIEERKLHINDIALATVADDFITYTQTQGDFPMKDSAEFILIASTLLLIKSKSLLPSLELTEHEQSDIAQLELRLKLYQRFRHVATLLRPLFGNTPLFAPEERPRPIVFSAHPRIAAQTLLAAVKDALQNIPKPTHTPTVTVRTIISLEDMIERLSSRVQRALSTSFKEFAGIGKKEKVEVIVSFLAMLELVKRGVVAAKQNNHFEDITIETEIIGVPTFN